MDSDSAFARLTGAWHVLRSPASAGEIRPATAAPALVLHASLSVSTLALPGSEALLRLESAQPQGAAQLQSLLSRSPPAVLLVDVELCALLDVDELRALQRAAPSAVWVLLWSAPGRWHELVLRCDARGAVTRGDPPEMLARALHAVLRGELWFSRAVMQALYQSLRVRLPASAEPAVAPADGGLTLTVRETQALALMREGLTNAQIGARLGISINTVKKHLASVFDKRGLQRRRQARD